MMSLNSKQTLLSQDDPNPVEIFNPNGTAPILLVCEHAGKSIPKKLDGLGISKDELERHIGWDIGAASVTRMLSSILNAPAVLQNYSRLVIDCNRPLEAKDSVPQISDGTPIPKNIEAIDKKERGEEIFKPFHDKISDLFSKHQYRAGFSIHSFTPMMQGKKRPWDIGFLSRRDNQTSKLLAKNISSHNSALIAALNQPYQIDDQSDWFIPKHCEVRNIFHSLIEIRNDHIADFDGQNLWANMLAKSIQETMKELFS